MAHRSNNTKAGRFFKDFQDFLLQGNVVDLAVAVVIGGAFGNIVNSFVTDIITPALLNPALEAANVKELSGLALGGIKYGLFLAAVLNFVAIAFIIFIMIRIIEKARKRSQRQQEIAEATPTDDPTVVMHQQLIEALERLTQTLNNKGL
ncbi:MAG: large conductance mechanosensitive channel protein MscL [Acaryochloridaceae cyanobacterium SU_2_1]|nr:large conductance mechanosensitive channel protein MscL [Acaryochloridaceae cyanobacterium SU_2_1]